MHMPYLNSQSSTPNMITEFGGYDHNTVINEAEFYDMKNLTSDKYPLASNRDKRGFPDVDLGAEAEIVGICGKDKINIIYKNVEYTNAQRGSDGEVYAALPYTKDAKYKPTAAIPYTKLFAAAVRTLPTTYGTCDNVSYYTRNISTAYDTTCYPVESTSAALLIPLPTTRTISSSEKQYSDLGACGGIYFNTESQQYKAFVEQRSYCFTEEAQAKSLIGQNIQFYFTSNDTSRNVVLNPKFEVKDVDRIIFGTNRCDFTIWLDKDEVEATSVTMNDVTGTEFEILKSSIATQKVSTLNWEVMLCIGEGEDNSIPAMTKADAAKPTLNVCEYDTDTGETSYDTYICQPQEGRRQIIEMGAYIEVFPEKYQINTTKKEDNVFSGIEPLEESVELIRATVRLTRLNGKSLNVKWVQDKAPTTRTKQSTGKGTESVSRTSGTGYSELLNVYSINSVTEVKNSTTSESYESIGTNDCWVDTSGDNPVAKLWSEQQQMWTSVQGYMEIVASEDGYNDLPFEEGDAVHIEFPDEVLAAIKPAEKQKYWVVSKSGENSSGNKYIRFPVTVKGKVGDHTEGEAYGHDITITRKLPDMDYIVECQNRLWGCRYGTDEDGETINEIFASKLADAKNWHYFSNTSVDSYYVSLGSDGGFTGAVSYQSTPVFFKQNCIHRIIGNYPAQYYMNTLECYGIKEGCDKSAIVMNDIVYYMSPVGMLAYAGSLPQSLAEPFGAEKYSNAISGTVGNRLYVSMQDESNNWNLFTFDDSRLCWHKEDNLHAKAFCTFGHECLAVDTDENLVSLTGVYGTKEGDIEWSMTSGEIGYGTPMRKRLLKLVMRLKLDINARAKIEIQYDGDGTWRYVNDLRPTGKTGGYSVPICPTRCDHFSIRISGKGNINLLSITKFYTEGSDKD